VDRFDSVDEDVFAKRASSFGGAARAYAEHRPNYPLTGIRWVVSGAARPVHDVLDLGAGTGKLTEGLLALDFAVTAVEPDRNMLAELTRRFPQVTALIGTAERIPLPARSVDAVLAGQAFHWFDPDRALTEIARVLRPGGVVGALWNDHDQSVGWVAGLAKLNRTSVSGVGRTPTLIENPPDHPAFGPFDRETFAHVQRRTAESLTAAIGTSSHTLVVSDEERADLLARVRGYLDARPETAHGEFDLPMTTTVLRAVSRTDVALEDQA
jgi:SAM-dependent methyltransferase